MTVFYILLPIGLLLIVISLGLGSYQHWSISHGNVADGTVVENVPRARGGSPRYSPKIEFRTKQGRDVAFMTSFSSNPPTYSKGDKLKVVYDGDGATFPHAEVYWNVAFDPELHTQALEDNWDRIDYIVADSEMLNDIKTYGGDMIIINDALKHSVLEASYSGDNYEVVQIFRVIHLQPAPTG